jgi:hypothetical protein
LGQAVSTVRWTIILDGTGSGAQWRILCNSSGTQSQITVSSTFSTGVWHHIASTYKANTGVQTTYLDGTSVGTSTLTTPAASCNKLYVANTFNNSQPFAGYMSRFCLFN